MTRQMQTKIKTIANAFHQKINLLIVDDYTIMLSAIIDLLASPIFNKTPATSAAQARDLITGAEQWHCWIFDIALEEEQSGLHLLEEHSHFPFTIMLSGMRSMSIASRAMQIGAYRVFDKNPDLLPALHAEVCTLAALGYILGGIGTKYFSFFSQLSKSVFATPEEWANQCCVTVRQLERICTIHSHLTPRFIIALYYTLRYILYLNDIKQYPTAEILSNPTVAIDTAIAGHINFVHRHLDKIVAS